MGIRRHSPNEWWQLAKSATLAWVDDYASSMGAALSYYSVFSLAPLLLIVISIAGLIFGQDAARGEVFAQLKGLLGSDSAKAVEDTLLSLSKPSRGVTATLISVVVLLVGATSVFGELQNALDRIWRAPARDQRGGIWGLIRSRLLSFGMILGIAFLLMVSLVVSAALSALGRWWGGFFGSWEVLLQIVNVLVNFAFTTSAFAMIYKFMPHVAVQWHDVWWGAATTACLFTFGHFLISFYIGKSGIASGFGAAGSVAVIFVWVYYSAQIFLLGAEFTWVYANRFGSMRSRAADQSSPAPDPIDVVSEEVPSDRESVPPPAEREPTAIVQLVTTVGVALFAQVVWPWLVDRLAARRLDIPRNSQGRLRTRR